MRERGHASSLGWGKYYGKEINLWHVSGNWWGFGVGKTRVQCDTENCTWGCVLVFTGSCTLVIHRQINTSTDKTYHQQGLTQNINFLFALCFPLNTV